eukprot:scaffold302637_cov27-Tisochrysis_lutea.AAC.1
MARKRYGGRNLRGNEGGLPRAEHGRRPRSPPGHSKSCPLVAPRHDNNDSKSIAIALSSLSDVARIIQVRGAASCDSRRSEREYIQRIPWLVVAMVSHSAAGAQCYVPSWCTSSALTIV